MRIQVTVDSQPVLSHFEFKCGACVRACIHMCSTQIDARKEQLALAKTELKQAKKEAKTKGNSDPKLQAWVSSSDAAQDKRESFSNILSCPCVGVRATTK